MWKERSPRKRTCSVAQEENMFRRTDCHFQVSHDEYDLTLDRYRPEMTCLLTAQDGVVYLDSKRPRVCIRGPEDRTSYDLGYPWLAEEDVFSFWELRASAQDLRGGQTFDESDVRRVRGTAKDFSPVLHPHSPRGEACRLRGIRGRSVQGTPLIELHASTEMRSRGTLRRFRSSPSQFSMLAMGPAISPLSRRL